MEKVTRCVGHRFVRGGTEAESARFDPPRAKIGKLAKHVIGDTLNRLQANKCNGCQYVN